MASPFQQRKAVLAFYRWDQTKDGVVRLQGRPAAAARGAAGPLGRLPLCGSAKPARRHGAGSRVAPSCRRVHASPTCTLSRSRKRERMGR